VTYQLVIQAQGDTLADYDLIVAVEDRLVSAIGAAGEVDGHDVGSGEANIFILVDDPIDAFERVRPVLTEFGILAGVRVAYRSIGGHAYTLVWPPDSKEEFAIL
jgi:hypothetical protein